MQNVHISLVFFSFAFQITQYLVSFFFFLYHFLCFSFYLFFTHSLHQISGGGKWRTFPTFIKNLPLFPHFLFSISPYTFHKNSKKENVKNFSQVPHVFFIPLKYYSLSSCCFNFIRLYMI